MKQYVFFVLLCMTFGCKTTNEGQKIGDGVLFDKLDSAPKKNVPKENLPEWLVARINEQYETRPPEICKVIVYKGEWNKQTVYFIMDTFSSCLCNFFTKDGGRIDNLTDLRTTSKNWIIIYEYGDFVIDLNELFSN